MLPLFLDKELLKHVEGNVLFEGQAYYLNVETYSKELLGKWLDEEHILSAITNYHPKNTVLTLRFDNIVGWVNILGYQFDVRSTKLFDGLEGNSQFQALLDEINSISNKLTFNLKGTSHAQRKAEYEYNWNVLEVFDYYYQLVFTYPNSSNLEALINQCIRHPNTANQETTETVDLERSKKITTGFFKNLGSLSSFGKIDDGHALAHSAFAQFTHCKIGQRLLPLKVTNAKFTPTTNTVENRFLKFFLEDINAICFKILNTSSDAEITAKAGRLQTRIHQFLLNAFFKNIQRLTFVPSSSSVLLKKSGYKEIYYHFVQSKFSFRPILEDQKRQSHKSGLKNIATLYEIWVFFRIAVELFKGEVINETFNGQVLKNGSMVGAYTWQGKNGQLFYNKSYSKSTGGSYSVTLRPDVSLLIDHEKLFLFDAKYKFKGNGTDEEDHLMRIVKQEDIHKMHAYLDAIPKALTAIVVYPGTKAVFYPKTKDAILEEGLISVTGVGAVPLIPNQPNKAFIQLLNLEL